MNNKTRASLIVGRHLFLSVFLLVFLAGCAVNPLHRVTGQVMTGYAEAENTPYVLAMNDVESACALGESVDPLLYSFSRVTSAPDSTGALLQILAGICMERETWQEELRYLRADYRGETGEMRDARTSMRRHYGYTAARQREAYDRALSAYHYDPSPDSACPCFSNDQEEITFLLGLTAGAQAVINDSTAGGRAGVPRRIAAQVERGAACLDNEKWAGLPQSLRAAVWLLLPDTMPDEHDDAWAVLADNRERAIAGGMRVAPALELVMAENLGKDETIAEVLAFLAETDSDFEVNPAYRLPDQVGMRMAWAVSDRFWTSHHGYRTPNNRFGETGTELDGEAESGIDTEGLL